jgi:hypothetical protein
MTPGGVFIRSRETRPGALVGYRGMVPEAPYEERCGRPAQSRCRRSEDPEPHKTKCNSADCDAARESVPTGTAGRPLMHLLVCHVRRPQLSIWACLMRSIEEIAQTSTGRLWLGRATDKVGFRKRLGPPVRVAAKLAERPRGATINAPHHCGLGLFRAVTHGGIPSLLTAASGAAAVPID